MNPLVNLLANLLAKPLALLLRLPIHVYRLVLSPVLPVSCRYAPSCSTYALEALAAHGPLKGSWLAVRRILRCHPWGDSGYDPVPPRGPSKAPLRLDM